MSNGVLKGLAALLAAGSLVAAGCGGDDDEGAAAGGDGGKPAEMTIPYVATLEGPAGPFAERMRRGAELALEQANAAGDLGTKLSFDFISTDSANAQETLREVSSLVRDKPPAILYGTDSATATALVPVAQRSKVPLALNQSGGEGVVETGEYIFRTTAPQYTYQEPHAKFLAEEGVKRIGIIYGRDNATLNLFGTKLWPELAKANGMEVVEAAAISFEDTSLGPVVNRVLSKDVDAVLMFVIGAQNATIVGELERRGFDGRIGAQTGIGTQVLQGLKAQANGITFATDFTLASKDPSSQKFAEDYKAKYDEDADTFAATGYDNALFAIEAVKRTKDGSSEAMKAAMQEVSDAGLPEAAVGPVTFESRDARTPGEVVEWMDGEATIGTEGG